MSVEVTITLTSTAARERLAQLQADLSPGPARRAFMGVLGRTAEKELRGHFRDAEASKRNKQGWKRQHFWSRIRRATAYDPALTTDSSATVVIADPAIKIHVYGGIINRRSKNLAIPLQPEAYGVRPSSGLIAGLFFIPSKRSGNTVGWLAAKRGEETVFYYRLQKSVTIRRDPTALPSASRMDPALLSAAEAFLLRRTTK